MAIFNHFPFMYWVENKNDISPTINIEIISAERKNKGNATIIGPKFLFVKS